jgi:hypothetical protein
MSYPTSPLATTFAGSAGHSAPHNSASTQMTNPSVRSNAMLLMHEELARARMSEMQEDAENYRRCQRLLAARRWQRKAARATQRARRAQNAIW